MTVSEAIERLSAIPLSMHSLPLVQMIDGKEPGETILGEISSITFIQGANYVGEGMKSLRSDVVSID